ncbi:MAG: protoheme IX farnesyltransferase [Deltaproteobacteria bacterium]|nr:protoheme IX farnesyltransferase [Deltaproteobacteria bacterium]
MKHQECRRQEGSFLLAEEREHPRVGRFISALVIVRPGIAAGVTLAGLAGMVLAGRSLPPAEKGLLCLACILLAACGSAVINGLLDEEMDGRMVRLSARVSALKSVGRRGALVLSLSLILVALAASWRFLNGMATVFLLAAVASYTVIYTLYFKRRSPYGTVPGGIPGALPVLIGYAAVEPRLGADGVLLFLLMLLWQPPHFWALALKYQEDYRSAGVPVLPVALGEPYTKILIFIYAAALLPLSLGLWWIGVCTGGYAAAAVVLGVFFLCSCLRNIVFVKRFGRAFGASILYITGLLVAIILDVSARGVF